MKKFKPFLHCVGEQIEKKFFKERNDDKNHTCEKLKDMTVEVNSVEELKLTEEYLFRYKTTTRWQTL